MANEAGKIGEAYVELRARMDKLEADFARAKAESSAYADRIQADGNRAADATERSSESIGKSLKKQVAAFTSLVSRVTAVIGVFTAFFQIGQRVSAMLESGTEKADGFLASIAGTDSAAKVKQLDKEIDALTSKIEGSRTTAGYIGNLLFEGLTPAGMRAQVQRLEQARVAELRAVNAKTLRERESKAKETAEAEKKQQMEKLEELIRWEQSFRDDTERDRQAKRERDLKDWSDAEKEAAEEYRSLVSDIATQQADAMRAVEDDMRRSHENFKRMLFDRSAVDIRRLERAIKFASLNR